MGEHRGTVVEFPDGRVDFGRRELIVGGRLVDLQPLVFDLLACFVAHAGQVLDKDTLLEKVWGHAVGSDAMIARAVMKLRRALGDDGQEPRWLKTVHRVGYRLDLPCRPVADTLAPAVAPEAAAQAAPAQVLLPCRNLTGDSALDWAENGVPGLVQQLLGPSTAALPPADWLSAPGAGAVPDALARACELVGAAQAVETTLRRQDGTLQLEVRRGRDDAAAGRFALEADSVSALARQLSQALGPAAPAPAPAPTNAPARPADEGAATPTFWEEQLARALDLDRRGLVDRALALMDECVDRLPPSPQLWLAHAAMLRRMGRRDDAGERARAALGLADGTPAADLRARALFEMGVQAWHELRPDDAESLCAQALAAARETPAGAVVVTDILAMQASIARERAGAIASIRLAEQAIAAAVAIGNRAKEAHARVVLGSTLLHAGQNHRAGEVLRRAAELSQRQGLLLTEAFALRTLALLDEQSGRYTLAIDEARRAAALAASCGNPNVRDSARVQEVVSLVHAGQLAEAGRVAQRLQTSAAGAWENAYSLRYASALLAWRLGEGRAATLRMRAVADEGRDKGLRFADVARLEECLQWIGAGDFAEADAALDDLRRAGARVSVLQAQAARQLAQGHRADAIETLRHAAEAAMLDAADSVPIDINLAWLLIEGGRWQDAGASIGQVVEAQSEQLPARIVNAAYLLASGGPAALATGEWPRLLQAAPRLLRRGPWLDTPDIAERLRDGRLPPLPELLTRACW